MKSLADAITDLAHSHFAWDANEDDPGTRRSLQHFKEKLQKLIRTRHDNRPFNKVDRYKWLKANFPYLIMTPGGWSFKGEWIAGYGVSVDNAIKAAMQHDANYAPRSD